MEARHAPGRPPGDGTDAPTRPSGGRTLRARAADPVYRFAWLVIAAGAAALGVLIAVHVFDPMVHLWWPVVLFTALAIGGEMVDLRSPRQHDDSRISCSNLFAFTGMLMYGSGVGIVAFATGVLVWGAVRRVAPLKIAFNVAQYLLAITAGAVVLATLTNVPHAGLAIHPGDLPAVALAALAMLMVNNVCTLIVTALAMGIPLRVHLRRELLTILIVDGILVGFAPIVVVAAHFSLAALPLLALPLAVIFYSARQAELREQESTHDGLTGLANRTLFRARVEQALERLPHTGNSVSVLVLDLDNFKDFNDTLGHNEADGLLVGVAERLRAAVGPQDLVARLGSDDFGLLVVGRNGAGDLRQLAACVRSELDDAFLIAGLRLGVSASVGISWSGEADADAGSLLRHADVAMHRAKVQRTGVELYDPSADPYSPERLVLAGELREGISRGELVLHYQPKLAVGTGEVVGVEALVRWRHPERGLVPPGEFIELAERTDVIGALTMNVLRMALGQLASWRRVGIDLPVAVNLPAQMLLDRDLPGDVASMLARFGLSADRLVLEITEGSLIHDPHRSAQILDALSGMGVRIAIDDFGTGYSSLAWLKRFPVHEIKVDRSFVTDLVSNESDAAIVRSTIELGRSLGLLVVAEGVETGEVLERLAGYGCDVVQGFLVSRPVPAAQLVTWLRARDRVPGLGFRVSETAFSTPDA
ncbi:MAG TPA: bifunctional diguanylate cyclase/phosphodiesterase [Thermoleophilaceae bacterium]